MPVSPFFVHTRDRFRFIDEGPGSSQPPLVLLHGMLGDLSNWFDSIQAFADQGYRVLVPVLPVYNLPLPKTSISGLVEYVEFFLQALEIDEAVLIGNSLGGHVALLYAMHHPDQVRAMILSGASGIKEVMLGTGTPRRHDREFIRERAAVTFYDPTLATDELVDEMYEIVTDRNRVTRLIRMARATRTESVASDLYRIQTPTLLVWGQDDVITPPDVAREFLERMPDARLRLIDRCGHAPMIERPETFNSIALAWLHELTASSASTRKTLDAGLSHK